MYFFIFCMNSMPPQMTKQQHKTIIPATDQFGRLTYYCHMCRVWWCINWMNVDDVDPLLTCVHLRCSRFDISWALISLVKG